MTEEEGVREGDTVGMREEGERGKSDSRFCFQQCRDLPMASLSWGTATLIC